MTKNYLSRVVDSFVREGVPKGDEDRLREQVRQNIAELASSERVGKALSLDGMKRSHRILVEEILTAVLCAEDLAIADEDLFSAVREHEQGLLENAQAPDVFAFSDEKSIEIYQAVLEVALEDDQLTPDEFRLLERLRAKLGLSRTEHRYLEARLGQFPKPGNELHEYEEYKQAAKQLQIRGILFYCNRAEDGPLLVLPDEVADAVKKCIGFEMRPASQELLQQSLSNEQLKSALRAMGLAVSGSKQERSDRLMAAGCRASEVLETLKNSELGALCRKLPGLNVTGSKQERSDRIIDYFASLSTRAPEESEDPRAVYYQYLVEYAARDNQNLYQLKLIKHDRDMERGFEEGTRYLFEEKLGCELIEMPGSEHADGGVEFSNGELLLWDNKGKESTYTFPKSHLDQFKRYIRESVKRVNIFLVIVPEIDPKARLQAMRLKHESKTDTDVALITATDLKWVAEQWPKFASGEAFSIEIFNTTGILDRQTLEERMQILL